MRNFPDMVDQQAPSADQFIFYQLQNENSELTQAEVSQIIAAHQAIGGKRITEQIQVLRLSQMVEFINQTVHLKRKSLNEDIILSLHKFLVLRNANFRALALQERNFQSPYVLADFVDWIKQQSGSELKIAFQAQLKMIKLEVFQEQLPETAWLVFNWLLVQAGYSFVWLEPAEAETYHHLLDLALQGRSWEKYEQFLESLVARSIRQSSSSPRENILIQNESFFKIGHLASQVNETIPTLRYWTKLGLLPVADQTPGGYALYGSGAIQAVIKLRELQREKRLTLEEIKELINKQGSE